MEIPSILIGLLLIGASVSFVTFPFWQKRQKQVMNHKAEVQNQEQRESTLSALRDLDFDFKTGKVIEEDYTPLRARLMAEAAQHIEQQKEQDDQLEALIQSRRAARQPTSKCDQCGTPVQANQRFCSKCGSSVNHELCSSCGRKFQAGDLFCSSCGNKIEVQMEAVGP